MGWKPGCKPYWIVEYKFIITSFEEFLNSTTSKAYIVQATKLQVWQTSKKIKIPTWHFISIHRFNMLNSKIQTTFFKNSKIQNTFHIQDTATKVLTKWQQTAGIRAACLLVKDEHRAQDRSKNREH